MLIIRLIGGIGNQLFQYAFGKYIEKTTGQEVFFNVDSYLKINKERRCELKQLLPTLRVSDRKYEFVKHNGIGKKLWIQWEFRNRRAHYVPEKKYGTVSFHPLHIYFLDGYWQWLPIVESVSKEMTDLFAQRQALPPPVAAIREELVKAEKIPIALHVRRGDYLDAKNLKIYGVCDSTYYYRAVGYFREKLPGFKLYIFSDDINWVEDNLFFDDVMYVRLPEELPAYWSIYLMSLCSHNIISNSSFSWWAAFLNRHPGKIVIAPKQWLRSSDETLALPAWIKL